MLKKKFKDAIANFQDTHGYFQNSNVEFQDPRDYSKMSLKTSKILMNF